MGLRRAAWLDGLDKAEYSPARMTAGQGAQAMGHKHLTSSALV